MKSYIVVNSMYANDTEIRFNIKNKSYMGNTRYVIFSKNVSRDYITSTYIFRFECHIVFSDYFINSYVLSANEAGHDGTVQDRLTEMHDDIKLLILL